MKLARAMTRTLLGPLPLILIAATAPAWALTREDAEPAPAASDPAGVPVAADLAQLGLSGRCRVCDLWAGRDLAPVEGALAPVVAWHGVALYRLSPEP